MDGRGLAFFYLRYYPRLPPIVKPHKALKTRESDFSGLRNFETGQPKIIVFVSQKVVFVDLGIVLNVLPKNLRNVSNKVC